MSWMELTSSLVSSLAWPTCVFLIVFFLRRGFINMLTSGSLKSLKAGPAGVEMEYFDRTLESASVSTEEQWTETKYDGAVGPSVASQFDALREYAINDPSGAISESFTYLGELLRVKLAPAMRPILGDTVSNADIYLLIASAVDHGVVPYELSQAFRKLSTLRDTVVNSSDEEFFDTRRALAYIDVTSKLADVINSTVSGKPDQFYRPSDESTANEDSNSSRPN